MTFASNVQPRRRTRDKPSAAWVCACLNQTRIHPGYLTRCNDCGTKRPALTSATPR